MDRELRDRLYWLNEELSQEDRELLFDEDGPEFIAPPRRRNISRAQRFERQRLQELDPVEQRSMPVRKKKGIRGYVILAILEILGILLVMGWWLQWLI